MNRIAHVLCCALALAGSAPRAQPAEPRLEIVSPAEHDYVSGVVVLRALVEPASPVVRTVQFFADAALACTLERPPFECQWDAGPAIREHHVRVVATLVDGRRLVQSLRTRGRPAPAFRSAVEGVQVTAVVKDRRGRFVLGLGPLDFRVREDGVPQEITYFATKDDALEIVIAVDISGSMSSAMPDVKAAVNTFLAALRPIDLVTLLAFNDSVFTVAAPETDAQTRQRRVDQLEAWGGTSLYDAILTSHDTLHRESGRKAVVVFTDGDDRSSRATQDLTEHRLKTGNAVLYAVGLGRGALAATVMEQLERLSAATGGRAFFARNAKDLEPAFRRILEEISHHYVFGYTPTTPGEPGSWRRITLDVVGRRVHVTVREGYVAERGDSSMKELP